MVPQKNEYDVIIVGGGLAGLTSAILLARKDINVLLIEKKAYPFHRVCGEYVSNEVLDLLNVIEFDPFTYGASSISKLRISTPSGKNIRTSLDLGGFGLSRFTMDNALAMVAKENGAEVLTNTTVTDINFKEDHFKVKLSSGESIISKLVIGSHGKRDTLDKKLNREFINEHTGYLGVKYHVKVNYPVDEIGLDNFSGGYCGIGKVEDDKYNLCYLYKLNPRVNFNSIPELEEKVLFKNPVIKSIFSEAHFVSKEPEVISEISFEPKQLIEDHILMCGDSAGLITPLCGNGMAMAIHSAKLLIGLIADLNIKEKIEMTRRIAFEKSWQNVWSQNFSKRLRWGRRIQTIFGRPAITGIGVHSIHSIPQFERWLISKTHGQPVSTEGV